MLTFILILLNALALAAFLGWRVDKPIDRAPVKVEIRRTRQR